jgi:hypothetical protein
MPELTQIDWKKSQQTALSMNIPKWLILESFEDLFQLQGSCSDEKDAVRVVVIVLKCFLTPERVEENQTSVSAPRFESETTRARREDAKHSTG